MAGFFDTLFGGGAEKEAADKDRQALAVYQGQVLPQLTSAYNTGTGALNTAYGTGTSALGQGYTQGQDALRSAIAQYAPLSALGSQYSNQAQGYYGRNASAEDMMANALGLNGPSGNAAATSAFRADPGYDWAMSQGMDALNRRRAAGGMLNTGNADVDAIKYGQGLADQQYQNWLQNVRGYGTDTGSMANTLAGMGLSATGAGASGAAQGYTNLANLGQTYGQNLANLAQGYGLNTANLAKGYGEDVSGVYGNVASGNIGANNLQAAGEAAGAKNLLNAGLSLATLGMSGSGGLGSSLGSMMSPGMGNSLFGGMNAASAPDWIANAYARSQGIPV